MGVGVLQSVLEVSDQLFWEGCRECSYHFPGLGVLEYVLQSVLDVSDQLFWESWVCVLCWYWRDASDVNPVAPEPLPSNSSDDV